MELTRNRRARALGVTAVLALAGAAVCATAASPAGQANRTGHHRPGLLAIVGWGLDTCGDNNKTQQQGGTGTTQNKACFNSGVVQDFPSLGSWSYIGPAAGASASSVVGAGNAIGASPTGVGASENNGIGA